MKTLAKNMLGILILCLVISGCAKPVPEPRIEVIHVNQYVECPAPRPPIYGKFSEEIHVGHLGNLEMLRENLEKALKYNDSLENTLECYRKQTESK